MSSSSKASGVLIGLVALTGCNLMTASAPATVTRVAIVPTVTGLKVADRQTFTVVETLSDGTSRNSGHTTWTTDNDAVAKIGPDGTLVALSVGRVTIIGQTDSGTAQLALSVVADATGKWVGSFRIGACQRGSGLGPSPCITGSVHPITIVLSQIHDGVFGTAILFASPAVGSIAGTLTETSSLTISGRLMDSDGGTEELMSWTSTIIEGGIAGTFQVTHRFTNAFGPQVLVYTCEISSLTHVE